MTLKKLQYILLLIISLTKSDLISSFTHYDGEEISLTVDSLTSITTQIPYDYYYLNICPPEDKMQVPDNLGEILQGSRKYITNYKVNIKNNTNFKILCKKKLSKTNINAYTWLINNNYKINLFLDLLPAGYVELNEKNKNIIVSYNEGIPLGFIANYDDENSIFINNHYRLFIHYNEINENKSTIVGFEIEPFSLILNQSFIDEVIENNIHIPGKELKMRPPQKLITDEEIYFTYDIKFLKSNIPFASRFDHYKKETSSVHWIGLINSNILIILLTIITICIFIRALRNDIQIYNRRVNEDEIIDEYGWKNISNEVFRKPINSELLSAFFGTGIQVIIALLYTLFFAFIGFFKPESRGSLLTMLLMVFIFIGIISGYLSGRLYKIFKGRNWLKSALYTALLFPSFCFGLLLIINWLYRMEDSTILIEFRNIISLIILWICCSLPLVLLGSFIGIKQKGIELPCKVNPVPALIEEKNWFFKIKYAIFFTGLPPFGAIFIEFLYIMSALWKREFSFMPQFIFLSVFVLIITSSEIGILFTHANLCKGDYNWWWKSFFVSGSPSIYVILYSIYYYFKLKIKRLSTTIIFFGMMSLIAFMIFLMCGAFGMGLTFFFIRKIYSMIKMD